MMTASTRTLAELPPEIISQVVSHAPSANFLRNLSLTSRSLHDVVEKDGWSAFVTKRFPSISVPPYWRDAAHALTTLSRNFDRRAFIAQDLGPEFGKHATLIRKLPGGKISTQWRRPQGQTMGYQPVIDSHEEWTGNSWADRRETVAWGAGAEVVVKIVQRGSSQLLPDDNQGERDYNRIFDRTGNSQHLWLTHRRSDDLEGRDDITSLNLVNLPARQSLANAPTSAEQGVDAIVGRASGGLELLRLWTNGSTTVKHYDTQNLPIRSADVTTSNHLLLGTCLGDAKIALYSVDAEDDDVQPVSETSCLLENDRGSRSWSAQFLCPDKLAVGRGISTRIVSVYSVRPDGLSDQPIRTFGSCPNVDRPAQTSAYPIVPLPESSANQDVLGDVFWSGGHDGIIRLHDMRSASDCQATIEDPVDRSAIFSLATVGRERLVAGAAAHCLLKVFDLRMAGGRTYSYQDLNDADPANTKKGSDNNRSGFESSGWNAFTMIFSSTGIRRIRTESPVYSLSRPSPSSTSLYVGTENTVSHFNFTSMSDQHPDPVFGNSIIRGPDGKIDSQKTWNPRKLVIPLNIYEREGQAEGQLMAQKYTGYIERFKDELPRKDKRLAGYDEAWNVV